MILLYAWLSMIFIGIAHGQDASVPALGYWTVVFVGIAARILLTNIQTATAKKAGTSKPTIGVVNQTINNTGKARV